MRPRDESAWNYRGKLSLGILFVAPVFLLGLRVFIWELGPF